MRLARPHERRASGLLLLSVLLLVGLFASDTAADSRQRNPLRTLSRVDEPVLHAPAHHVHALSHFQISFTVVQQDGRRQLPVRLRLEPNHNILADDAAIHHQQEDGSVTIEPINRLDHRVFGGDVFIQDRRHGENHWTNAGWASIYVHVDGSHPVFEGAFNLHGDHYHIQTSHHYRDTRLPADPLAAEEPREYMVVWRDSDILSDAALCDKQTVTELRRRQLESGGAGDLLSMGATQQPACSADGLLFNTDDQHPVFRGIDLDGDDRPAVADTHWLFGRQIDGTSGGSGNSAGVNLSSTIGNPTGCPTTRKVALMGIAADCNYAGKFAARANVSSNIILQISSASKVYESTFNISLGIQNLTILSSTCPTDASSTPTPWNADCSTGITITDRLNLFSRWRGENANDTNAFWMLLSTCPTDSAVGLAWLGQLCTQGAQANGNSNETTAATNVVMRTATEWQVMAHEAGHTFGAVHDCTATTCSDGTATRQQCCPLSATECNANGQYIMNPSTGSGITQFSACSMGNICSAIGRNSVKTSCLANNKDVVTITGSQCGNGIVEAGEDCDCGGTEGCGSNPCCNPTTCKFATNALCDPASDECCTSACQLASAGTVCRASTGSCDPAETCTGASAACPTNVNSPDGTTCGASGAGLSCASGQCTSRDLQCKTLMGSYTTTNDTYACSSDGCQISCASPEFGYNRCLSMMQNFLDGTSCQGGGRCSNGACRGSSVTKEISNAIRSHLNIVIPVSVVVGVLVLLVAGSCLWSCIQRCRRRRRRIRTGMPPPGPAMAMTAVGATRGSRNASANALNRRTLTKPGMFPPVAGGPPSRTRWSWRRNKNASDGSQVGFARAANLGPAAGDSSQSSADVPAGYPNAHLPPTFQSPPPPYSQPPNWVPPFRGPAVRYA